MALNINRKDLGPKPDFLGAMDSHGAGSKEDKAEIRALDEKVNKQ